MVTLAPWTSCCTRWQTRAGARFSRFSATTRRVPESWPRLSRSLVRACRGHLRVLREAGLVDVRQDAQRRIYTLRPEALVEVDEWLGEYRRLWENRLDALHTEIARGKKARR